MNIKRKIKELVYDKLKWGCRSFPYFGVKVYFPKGSHLFYRACAEGVYEQSVVDILSLLVKKNTFFFDVGANIGLISIPILKNNPSCRCISFEPSPNALPYLERTLSESSLADRWQVIGRAVGAESGESDFYLSIPELGAYEGLKSAGRVLVDRVIKVPVSTIDQEWYNLGKPKVTIIKIDVEGAELLVLRGAQDCIKNCRPYIVLEWNDINLDSYQFHCKDLLLFVQNINYRLFSIPYLMPVENETSLRVQMLKIENFLLAPND